MKNKKELTKYEINKIKELYYKKKKSIRKVSENFPYSYSFIQKQIHSFEFEKHIKNNYPLKNNYQLTLKCKKTNKIFVDYKNQSGVITSHILNIFPNIIIDSNYKRKSIEYKTGKFWYDNYFTINYIPIKKVKKCSYCDWMTKDIYNKSGAYEKHLINIHNINLKTHLKNYPEDRDFIKKEIYNILITCKICNEEFKSITNTHLKEKHNITPEEYKLRYGYYLISPKTRNKLIKTYNKYLKFYSGNKKSKLEEFIKENVNIKFIENNRKILNGKEIDLIDEKNKIGIEINGNIFHTELFGGKDKNYHLNKTELALKEGYDLIHIFSDELLNNPTLIINKINHILNLNESTKIHARKCIISENIAKNDKSIFLNENHIQGNDKSKISIVAHYNDEIVGIMTFDNKRYMNKSNNHNNTVYELARFTIKNEYVITGIASRLLSYFIKTYEPTKIISFADRRWTPNSNNNLYSKLGFELTKTLKPDYWYFNPKYSRDKRFHKFGFGKNSIKKKFPSHYNENKTEWEMMQELGFDRIWDCGKFKYELNF